MAARMATMESSDLNCMLCPGQPTFSDMSHFLTHVASKAHLSHQFKLSIRSNQEPDIAEALVAFNYWLEANNIPKLLAERMAARGDNKNKRRSRPRQASSNASRTPHLAETNEVAPSERTMPTPPGVKPASYSLQGRPSANPVTLTNPLPADAIEENDQSQEADDFPAYIDPRLRDPYSQARPSANPATLTSPLPADAVDANAQVQETHDFPEYIDPRLRRPHNPVHQNDLTTEEGVGGDFDYVTQFPSLQHAGLEHGRYLHQHPGLQLTDLVTPLANSVVHRTGGSDNNIPASAADLAVTDSTNNPGSAYHGSQGPIADDLARWRASLPATPIVHRVHREASIQQEIEADDRARELTRLKGVVLPGMNIFDAATPEMRRLRNQKKDGTIVQQLEKTSRLVQPTEQIYTSGKLVKCRVIDGSPTYDSPVEGESPVQKKGSTRRKRGILQEIDPNIQVGKGGKRAKRNKGQKPSKESHETDPFIHRGSGKGLGVAVERQDEDMRLTAQTLRKRTRAALTVYKDVEEKVPEGKDVNEKKVERQMTEPETHALPAARGVYPAQQNTLTMAQLEKTDNSNIAYNHGHTIEAEQSIEPNLDAVGYYPPTGWNLMAPFVNGSDAVNRGGERVNNDLLPYHCDEASPNGHEFTDEVGYYWNPLRGPRPAERVRLIDPSDDEETVADWADWKATRLQALFYDAGTPGEDYPALRTL